jgi:hypothetical protein
MQHGHMILKFASVFSLTGMEGQRDECGRRVLLGDNTGGVAVLLLPISFQWRPLYNLHIQLIICILMPPCAKFDSHRTSRKVSGRVSSTNIFAEFTNACYQQLCHHHV